VSDLIERLRHEYCDGACEKNRFEAADEIGRLTAEGALKDGVIDGLNEEHQALKLHYGRLRAEVSKYRKALESIVGQTDDQYVDGIWREVNSTALDALAEVSSAHDAMREAQQFADACGPADALLAQVRRILWKALPDPVSGKRDIGKEILDSVEELKGADSSQCHCGSKFNEYGLCPECDFADEKGQTAHDDQETDNEL
jgi:hypothetical protein